MAGQSSQSVTNEKIVLLLEKIVRLLDEVSVRLADSKDLEEQIARDLTQLLTQK